MTGDLTLHGEKKSVTFDMDFLGAKDAGFCDILLSLAECQGAMGLRADARATVKVDAGASEVLSALADRLPALPGRD